MKDLVNETMGLQINIRQFKDVIRDMIMNTPKHSVLGLGGPGIGKSECVQQIAKELGYDLIDLRLAQMSEVEIGGLIYPSSDKTRTHWLTPDYFPTNNRTILLLDEITSASKRVQVAAYQLVLDRRVGQNKLPDGTIVIALGNREDDGGVYVELAAPLANRFEIYDIQCNASIWLEDYAKKYIDDSGKSVNPLVISYIEEHPANLHTQSENSDSIVFATPRTWKKVSDILNASGDRLTPVSTMRIKACLGEVLGAEFLSYAEHFVNDTTVREILAGRDVEIPKDPRTILYINSTLTGKFSEALKQNNVAEAKNLYSRITNVAGKEPADYAAALLNSCSGVEGGMDVVTDYDNQQARKSAMESEREKSLTMESPVDSKLESLGALSSMSLFDEEPVDSAALDTEESSNTALDTEEFSEVGDWENSEQTDFFF